MSEYFTLGSYSISILHYSLYHWDKREVVFLRPIRAYENWLTAYYGYRKDNQRMYDIWWRRIKNDPNYIVKFSQEHQGNFQNLNKYLDKVLEQVIKADKQKILIGKRARQYIKKVVAGLDVGHRTTIAKNISELKGIGASLGAGVVQGPARVIGSISQLDTMQEGEVLVVPSTSVDYVAAMKKAVAIVTEVGGLTCHAAIVSRELNKACIVNTLSATRIFKTGDLLEVNPKTGIVKKLSGR